MGGRLAERMPVAIPKVTSIKANAIRNGEPKVAEVKLLKASRWKET